MRKHIHLLGSIMSSAIVAMGIALDFGGVAKPFDWRWIELIGFLLFLFFIYKWIWSLNKRIQELEDKQPYIEVRPVVESKNLYLEVINKGRHQAKFEVKNINWNGINNIIGEPNTGYKGQTLERYIQDPRIGDFYIKNGDKAKIILLRDNGITLENDGKQYRYLHMPDSQYIERYGFAKLNQNIDITFQVFADPELKKGQPYEQTFKFFITDKENDWIKEVSNDRK
ncbi:MAG: hypothetical protein JW967_04815 [Dehalococcoidales bacterium]|nr:hypothetical protein [Dehalococcoidales bacterium]